MNIKSVFDYTFVKKLVERIINLNLNKNLIG